MSDFVNTIDLLGDEVVANSLIDKSITEFNDNVLTSFRRYAFRHCAALTSVDLPLVTTISDYAFYGCKKLTSVNTSNVTSIGSQAFKNCTALTSVNFPLVTSLSQSVFSGCSALTSVNFPLVPSLLAWDFEKCSNLTSADFPLVTQIANQVFEKCTVFKTLILRSSTLCTLLSTSAFNSTPFASGGTGGTLIVPRSLTTEYPNATNWSSLMSGNANNRVLALEDYTVDGTITGEIDWNKLNGGTT